MEPEKKGPIGTNLTGGEILHDTDAEKREKQAREDLEALVKEGFKLEPVPDSLIDATAKAMQRVMDKAEIDERKAKTRNFRRSLGLSEECIKSLEACDDMEDMLGSPPEEVIKAAIAHACGKARYRLLAAQSQNQLWKTLWKNHFYIPDVLHYLTLPIRQLFSWLKSKFKS